ncbi:MAG: hypothetical protein J3R72DRAFT_449571 [Linnemannia gamsii]|nr:MAG: hypothetical protein J3R72DRAFT_449571 [Linnemannia gamsii]
MVVSQETNQRACSPPTMLVAAAATMLVVAAATLVVVAAAEDVSTVELAVEVEATGDVAVVMLVVAAAELVVSVARLPTFLIHGPPLVETWMVIWTWVRRRRACKFHIRCHSYPRYLRILLNIPMLLFQTCLHVDVDIVALECRGDLFSLASPH